MSCSKKCKKKVLLFKKKCNSRKHTKKVNRKSKHKSKKSKKKQKGGGPGGRRGNRRPVGAPGRAHNRPGPAAGAVRARGENRETRRSEARLDMVARQAVAAGVVDPSIGRSRNRQLCTITDLYTREETQLLIEKRLNMIRDHAAKNPGARGTFTQLGFRLFMLPRDPMFMKSEKSQCIHNSIFRIDKNFDHRLRYGDNGECCPQSAHFLKNEQWEREDNVFYGISKFNVQSHKAIYDLLYDARHFAIIGSQKGIIKRKPDGTLCILFHFTKYEPLHIWIMGNNSNCNHQLRGFIVRGSRLSSEEERHPNDLVFENYRFTSVLKVLHPVNEFDKYESALHKLDEYKLIFNIDEANNVTFGGLYIPA